MILFIHIPKCGGNSVVEILKTQYPVCVNLVEDEAPGKPDVGYGHIDPFRHADNEFVFTFLRDPIERCLSLYTYIMALEGDGWKRYEHLGCRKDMPPEEFFAYPRFANVDNGITRQLSGGPFLYEKEFGPLSRQDYDLALSLLDRLDFVGLTGNFNWFITRLGNRLGWDNLKIPHLNSSLKLSEIDGRLVKLIATLNRYDLRLYKEALIRYAESAYDL